MSSSGRHQGGGHRQVVCRTRAALAGPFRSDVHDSNLSSPHPPPQPSASSSAKTPTPGTCWLPPQKSDGGFGYASTDLAAIEQRLTQEHADRVIYVTDSGQSQHFQMVFAAARKAGILPPGVPLPPNFTASRSCLTRRHSVSAVWAWLAAHP